MDADPNGVGGRDKNQVHRLEPEGDPGPVQTLGDGRAEIGTEHQYHPLPGDLRVAALVQVNGAKSPAAKFVKLTPTGRVRE